MGEYNYNTIKNAVFEWHSKLNLKSVQHKEIKENDSLIIDFEFKNCIAQLSVTEGDYRPYRFVYFEAMNINTDYLNHPYCEPVYSVYDTKNMNINDVLSMLDKALEFCANF